MDDRHESDYDIMSATSKEDTVIDVHQARHFVDEVRMWLRREKWLQEK